MAKYILVWWGIYTLIAVVVTYTITAAAEHFIGGWATWAAWAVDLLIGFVMGAMGVMKGFARYDRAQRQKRILQGLSAKP